MIWEGLGRMGRMGQSWGIQSGMLQACGCWLAPWRRYTERKPRTTLWQGTDVGYNRVITPTPFAITCTCRRYCMRKTVGVGEGRERGIMLCILSILRISCRASSSVTRITYLLHSMGPWGDCLKVSHLFRVCCYWKASPAVVNLECARWHSGHL